MNQDELVVPKDSKSFTIVLDNDLGGKVEYIKKRLRMSIRQIVVMCAAPNIEIMCNRLMDEEFSVRTARSKGSIEPALTNRLKIEDVPRGTF